MGMISVMFVCHGNICRSPMAEYIFKKMLAENGLCSSFRVESSAVTTEEIGNDIYPPARKVLARHSVPCPPRGARLITKSDISAFDYVLCMDASNLDKLYCISSESCGKAHLLGEYGLNGKNIADPWYTGDFDLTYEEIVRCCEVLLEKISK